MDSKLVISAALFLLLTFIDSGDSIKCYQCNSYLDANCADPFFYEDQASKAPEDRVMKDPDMLQECPAGDGKDYFCRKITQTVRGDERVIRSCGWVKDDKEGRDCYTTVLEEYNTLVCSCDGEGCNGATGFSLSLFATMSALVLAYLIH